MEVQSNNVTMCYVGYTTDSGTPANFSVPLNTPRSITSQPESVHYFEFSAMAHDHMLIRENISTAGWLIGIHTFQVAVTDLSISSMYFM